MSKSRFYTQITRFSRDSHVIAIRIALLAINNCYLDFIQIRCLISLVNDNHVDKNLKKFLCMYGILWLDSIQPYYPLVYTYINNTNTSSVGSSSLHVYNNYILEYSTCTLELNRETV